MEEKGKRMLTGLLLLAMFATSEGFFSEASQPPSLRNSTLATAGFFPITGNVHPIGFYSVTLQIGNPPKPFVLDIDTGSDITWVECDAPCKGCILPRDSQYKPKNNLVPCNDPLCKAIHPPGTPQCVRIDRCDFAVRYADKGSSRGMLVTDHFLLSLTKESGLGPRLTFGCGSDLDYGDHRPPPGMGGVWGLGRGKVSILSQLQSQGVIRNVFGHCLGAEGGYLFLGKDGVPSSGIVWTPMLRDIHYTLGPAEILLGGKATGIKGLQTTFDTGTTYTIFSSQVYTTILVLMRKDLQGKPLKAARAEQSFSDCWKGAKPFKSVQEVKDYFKPLLLSFTQTKNALLQVLPEAYLTVTGSGSVCLGIESGKAGSLNVIGDNFLQDKLVVYDNEMQRIGWVSSNCNNRPSKS